MQYSDEIFWTSGFFNERFPAPISPLGWSHLSPFIEELALRDPLRCLGYPHAETIPLTRLWHGHPYANALAFRIFYKVFPDFILPEDTYRYFPDGAVALRRRAPYPRWIDTPRLIFSLFRAFFSDPFNVSPFHNYRHWARYTHEHDARIATLRARVETLSHAEPREIFDVLRDAEQLHRGVLRIHRWSLMDADLIFGLLKRLTAAWIDCTNANDIAARLVADVPNKTLEMDAAIQELARACHVERSKTSRKELGETLRFAQSDKLTAFLAEHGHRSFSLDIAVPTFAEEPAQVERLVEITDHKRQTADKNIPSSFILRPSSFGARVIFDWVLALARHYLALREDQRYYWQKSLAIARRLYLMLAEHLVADGVVAERGVVFFATHQELATYFDARLPPEEFARTLAARQAEWREYQREFEQAPTESYPAFLRGDVRLDRVGAESLRPAQWRGRAISPGIARGIARVVQSASELSRVQNGDILVAPATDPAWTPVFARLAGLVVERGGVLSHSAVVAREYHIPAVAGIANIVAEIQEGELIEVDGSRGLVSRVVV
jgi:phosphohistidine swiveling domain-containing protein